MNDIRERLERLAALGHHRAAEDLWQAANSTESHHTAASASRNTPRSWLAFTGAFLGVISAGIAGSVLLGGGSTEPTFAISTPTSVNTSQETISHSPSEETEPHASCPTEMRGTEIEVGDPEFPITIGSVSVAAGSTVEIHIGVPAESNSTYSTGIAAVWQCWNGAHWVDTHLLRKGLGPQSAFDSPSVAESSDDWTVRLLAVSVPSTVVIEIPDVPPGIYRVVDTISGSQDGTRDLVSFLEVRVESAGR